MIPCKFFAKGRCARMESCQFAHTVSRNSKNETTRDPKAKSQFTQQNSEMPACRFFAEGRCAHGESCKSSHTISTTFGKLESDYSTIQTLGLQFNVQPEVLRGLGNKNKHSSVRITRVFETCLKSRVEAYSSIQE